MTSREPACPRRTDALLCALFLLAIAAPTIDHAARPAEARSLAVENREAAPAPVLEPTIDSVLEYPARAEAWFGDRLGLRDRLVRWHNAARLLLFGAEPTGEVVVGKDGWLFFTADQSVEIARGLAPFTEEELETWRVALEQRRDWLAHLGIEYLFAIVPNKETVYSERWPSRMNRVGPTRLEQLAAYLAARSDVPFLDLREALAAERREDREGDHVFFPLGTHWTERGAWAATNAILERLSARFGAAAPFARQDFRREFLPGESYDSFAKALRLDDLLPQACWLHVPVAGFRARTVSEDVSEGAVGTVVTEVDDAALPRALLVHDSFGPWLRPFLAERCSRLTSVWQHGFPKDVVWTEKPGVVVQMYTERALSWRIVPLSGETEPFDRAAFPGLDPLLGPLDLGRDLGGITPFLRTRVEPAPPEGAPGGEPGVAIESSPDTGFVYLPPFDTPEDACPVLHIDLTSPGATALEIWYTTRAAPTHDRKNHLQAWLRAGRNDLYLKLPVKGIAGRLLLRPGLEPGSYRIHALEARAARG